MLTMNAVMIPNGDPAHQPTALPIVELHITSIFMHPLRSEGP